MNTNPNAKVYQNSNSSTSTLRPRNPRLISYITDEVTESRQEIEPLATTSSSNTPPRFPSRGTSPLPSINRPRKSKNSRDGDRNDGHTRTKSEGENTLTSNGLWESWSSIQGIASTLLGNEIQSPARSKGKATNKHKAWNKPDWTYSTPHPTAEWGSSLDQVKYVEGSIEERQALVQAKKREVLLLANGNESIDAGGKYKRRDSDADLTRNPIDDDNQDLLAYLHTIKPQDTLAGVMIKYSCQPDVFRKVNRFWPSDNIQTRTHVYLPIDACSIRGRKVSGPRSPLDLLNSEAEEIPVKSNADVSNLTSFLGSETSEAVMVSPTSSDQYTSSRPEDIEYKHDSWVILPNFTQPVEILRIPRQILGYFPRPRRKSNSIYTDTSTTSTPKTSLDLLRHPPTHAAQASFSLNASPVRRPGTFPNRQLTRQRSSSTTASGTNFVEALRGPGGVGSLRGLRTEASRPGPAEDALNRQFAHYLPDVAPPEDTLRNFLRATPRLTPRASTDSVRSNRSNSSGLTDMSGAIEGWMRKISGNKKDKASGIGRMGDLIELETNTEPTTIVDSGEIDDIDRTPRASTIGQTTATEEMLLNERFPIRGRVMNAYGAGKDKNN